MKKVLCILCGLLLIGCAGTGSTNNSSNATVDNNSKENNNSTTSAESSITSQNNKISKNGFNEKDNKELIVGDI